MTLRNFNAVSPTFAKKKHFLNYTGALEIWILSFGDHCTTRQVAEPSLSHQPKVYKKINNIIEAFPLVQLSREQVTSQHT